jgi:HK97 family phage portal protein
LEIFGLTITRTKAIVPQTLSGVDSRGGWWPIIRESLAGAWQSGVEVEIANVLTYAPVYACIRLISSDIGKLRLRLVRQDSSGLWSETDSPSFSPVIRKPNRYQTRQKFIQHWLTSKLIHGNAYILKERDNRGVVRALYVLDPTRVRPLVAPDGSVYYGLQADNLSGLQQDVAGIPASEIIHDVHVTLYHPLVGISPISACGVAAVEALRIQENQAVFFGNGSQPGGVITAPGHIHQDTADRMKAYWDSAFTGANAGKVAVLGDQMDYKQMGVNANDAQLIEQLRWTAEDVCQAFGVPPYKINVGPPPNYSNIQALDLQYYSQCLQELMEGIEETWDFGVGLAPDKIDGQRMGVEFNRDDLLQMDTAGRVDAAQKSIISGLSPNEVRRKYHDAPPVDGGEIPFMQEQNWPIKELAGRSMAEDKPQSSAPAPVSPDMPMDPDDMPVDDAERELLVGLRKELELRIAA